MIRGSAWSLTGDAGNYIMRLGSNLLLTRLLFPEAFGLMALVNVVCQGLQTFSDVGLGPSIIQNKRGDDPRFLNTAFTMQVVRGVLLWLLACAAAWPLGAIYGEPQLAKLLPVAAIVAVISGFNTTNIYQQNRHLALKGPIMLELIAQLASIVVMVAWALVHRSVWALVAGNIVQSVVRAVLGHFILNGPRNGFAWDSSAAKSLVSFGKWIFVGTAMSFLAARSDRLILGKLMDPAMLGVYAIALVMGHAALKIMSRFARRILFPAFSRMAENDPDMFARRVTRLRGVVMLCVVPPLCLLAIFGQHIISLLYDSRYHEAGWMLQIIAAGGVFIVVVDSSMMIMMAMGDSMRYMLVMAVRSALAVAGLIVGGWLWGSTGAIVGLQLLPVLSYPALVWGIHRYGVWAWKLDIGTLIASGLVIAGGLYALGMIG